MPEQLQKIGNQILEWWKKYSTKQKALLISIAATILLALGILAVVVSTPEMEILVECANTAEAGEVKEILDGDGTIPYELSQDGLVFYVEKEYQAVANILLGQSGVPTKEFDISNVFEGGFSSTEADKTKRYKLYLEEHFAEHLQSLSNVESAYVTLDIPNDDGTILARDQDAYAAVILTLSEEMEAEQAAGIAKYIATQLGNEDTDHITILDSNSNVLFSGGDSETTVGTATSQLSLRSKTENLVTNKVKDVLVGSGLYDQVEVAPNLVMDFDQTNETSVEYSAPEGQTNGMINQQSNYESESEGGISGTPGTDSNDDTTYVIEDDNYTHTTVTDSTITYDNNKKVTEKIGSIGNIDYSASSISLVAKNYVIYNEDVLKSSGLLDEMTFDEYIAANSEPVKVEVEQEYYTMVANATGFPVESVSIIAFEQPVFQASTQERTLSDYMQIILAVLILLLLGYVVFRSTRKEKEVEPEPELPLDDILESTKQAQEDLEDIGFNEKSETRIMIEKFVQENPEATASLLRNWLNEEWE